MPIHFEDRDVLSQVDGARSALIVPCNLCPAVTLSVREQRPFLQLLRSPLASAPLAEYLESLRVRLAERGVKSRLFRSWLYHQWFLCAWTARRRRRLREAAKQHDAVIVLGCESATETVRQAVEPTGCRVIEGMSTSGITNAQLAFHLPCDVSFESCRVVPIASR